MLSDRQFVVPTCTARRLARAVVAPDALRASTSRPGAARAVAAFASGPVYKTMPAVGQLGIRPQGPSGRRRAAAPRAVLAIASALPPPQPPALSRRMVPVALIYNHIALVSDATVRRTCSSRHCTGIRAAAVTVIPPKSAVARAPCCSPLCPKAASETDIDRRSASPYAPSAAPNTLQLHRPLAYPVSWNSPACDLSSSASDFRMPADCQKLSGQRHADSSRAPSTLRPRWLHRRPTA
ncbi:uncharacterized protein V1510DRAFT_214243 [Dipodascopsis tothii]|uniref:uncharacterized protein n=1 Tax=Dipodascopsis tothii TaxID=44089 RepID=UPI0034CEF6C9